MTEQQPELEPVAYMRPDKGHLTFHKSVAYVPLYTEPPKREWIGLAPDDYEVMRSRVPDSINDFLFCNIVAIVAAKLKEKNT